MAVNVNMDNMVELHGATGGNLYGVTGAFSGSDQSVEVILPFQTVTWFVLTPIGQPATGEVLSMDETENGGRIVLAAGNSATIRRAATTTSGLKFALLAFGY